jgi:5-methylcytosine-specific restriction endonuclease McrA
MIASNPDFHLNKYWADVEQSRKQNREYYRQNREKRIQKSVEYARLHAARANATKKRYKLAKRNACPPWVYSARDLCDQLRYFYEEAKRLTEQTGIAHHVDHIVPIQGVTVCGLHVPWNLQVLTASENCSKQNRLLEELT